MKPTEDRLLVERLVSETKTAGGIIIPDTAQEKPMKGKVICTGPGLRNDKGDLKPMVVKAGDFIIFAKWSGTEIKVDGKELLIMKETDALIVCDGPDASKPC